MPGQRWLRIIPIALIMYTISYVDRANVTLVLDPQISGMMHDLRMDDRMKGQAAGFFFLGYVLLQIPAGYLASRWSARKIISIFLIAWGLFAFGAGFCQKFWHFGTMRFLLGVAESGVFPATLVLLANWFPRAERARANSYWSLCQPLAIVASVLLTGWLLARYTWRTTMMLEGVLPFVWLPVWWFGIRDHPREAGWISAEEKQFLETTLEREAAELQIQSPTEGQSPKSKVQSPAEVHSSQSTVHGPRSEGQSPTLPGSVVSGQWSVVNSPWSVVCGLALMVLIYFLHNCEAYGCMTFFSDSLKGHGFSARTYGLLLAVPYAVTALLMVLNSWHSDKTGERRGHVAAAYILSGVSLVLAVSLKGHFWISFGLMCLAIPGPFVALGPFWAIPGETLPRNAMALTIGLVNALGNLGGYEGPTIVGRLKQANGGSLTIPFQVLGLGLLVAAGLSFALPRKQPALSSAANESTGTQSL
ncbi:MAG: MFS transporter [Verrucomicrobia bacterium]|nr:MAG: MFS transporter [Verrucomicrobiota bacterium]